MARQLSDLYTELNNRVDDTIDQGTAFGWLNMGWQEALDYFPWPFLKASASGALSGSTATQLFSTFSVTNFKRMTQFLVSDIRYKRVDWEQKDVSGQSLVYAILPDMTGFMTPGAESGTLYMKYVRSLSDLTATTTVLTPASGETGIPEVFAKFFEEAMIASAAIRFYQQAGKPNMAEYWQSQRDYSLDQVVERATRLSEDDSYGFSTPNFQDGGSITEY